MMTLSMLALSTALLHATAIDAPALKVKPTRLRWCATLLELGRKPPGDRARVARALAEVRGQISERLAATDPTQSRQTRASQPEQIAPHHGSVRLNFRYVHSATLENDLRLAVGRLKQLENDLVTANEGNVARVDVGRENVLAVLDQLSNGAQSLQDASGEFEDGDPPFNRRAYARYLRNMGVVGTLALGFGSGTYLAINDHASNGVIALLGSSAVFSLRGMWDIRQHYNRSRSTREGRIRTENADVDRVDIELDAVERMRAVAAKPEAYPDQLVSHGYSLHVPTETFMMLMEGHAGAAGLSRSPFRLRRGEHTVLVDLTLFTDQNGELSLISSLRPKLTRDIPRSLANTRVVGEI